MAITRSITTGGLNQNGLLLYNGMSIQNPTAIAINATATMTAAQMFSGYITSTSASATVLTTPTATALATLIEATKGTNFTFYIDNIAGANNVTLSLDASITASVGTNLITIVGEISKYNILFLSGTSAKISLISDDTGFARLNIPQTFSGIQTFSSFQRIGASTVYNGIWDLEINKNSTGGQLAIINNQANYYAGIHIVNGDGTGTAGASGLSFRMFRESYTPTGGTAMQQASTATLLSYGAPMNIGTFNGNPFKIFTGDLVRLTISNTGVFTIADAPAASTQAGPAYLVRNTSTGVIESIALGSYAPSALTITSTTDLNSGSNFLTKRSATTALTAVTFTYTNIPDGGEYHLANLTKTNAAALLLTFPANTIINQYGENPGGLTALLNGAADSIYRITVERVGSSYNVFIARMIETL